MGQNNAHLKLRITKGAAGFDVLAFGKGNLALEFSQAKGLELAVTLSVNQWNGNTSLQLMLVDARVNGVQLYNIRGKQHPIPAGVPILDIENPVADNKAIVLANLPEDLSSLRSYFQEREFEAIYFKTKLPNRTI